MLRALWRLTLVSAVHASGWAFADVTVTFQNGVAPSPAYAGTRDTMIYSAWGLCWNPAETCDRSALLFDGSPASEGTLLRWDLSQLPTNAVVVSASIDVNVRDPSVYAFAVSEALRPWVATEVNWTRYAAGSLWQTPGGAGVLDHGPTLFTLNATVGGPLQIQLGPAALAVVQGWVSTPAQNRGLQSSDFGSSNGLLLWSSEAPVAARRPRLNVVTDGGAVLTSFQNGVAPTPAYSGTVDVSFGSGPDPAVTNYNNNPLMLGGSFDPYGVLLRFDVSTIPPWATVTRVRLELTAQGNGDGVYPGYALLKPWGETTAAWGRGDVGQPWELAGAVGLTDRKPDPVVSISALTVGRFGFDFNDAGVAAAQAWVSGTLTNNGLVFGDYDAGFSAITTFTRREAAVAADRPALMVTYVEGVLAFRAVPTAVVRGMPSSVMRVERDTLTGAPITAAPQLAITVSASSPTAELALDAAGPFSATLMLGFPDGGSETPGFVVRDSVTEALTLTATAGQPAWRDGQAMISIDETVPPVDAGEPDAGRPDGGQPGRYSVGCQTGAGGLSLLALLFVVSRASARAPRTPRGG